MPAHTSESRTEDSMRPLQSIRLLMLVVGTILISSCSPKHPIQNHAKPQIIDKPVVTVIVPPSPNSTDSSALPAQASNPHESASAGNPLSTATTHALTKPPKTTTVKHLPRLPICKGKVIKPSVLIAARIGPGLPDLTDLLYQVEC